MSKEYTTKIKDYTASFFGGSGKLDPEKRDELILNYTPLIKYIASRLASRLPAHVGDEDLINCGIIGLIDAIDKFDISKNVQFKTYAEFRIKGAMLDELRSLDWVPRSIRRKITELGRTYAELEHKLGRPANDEEVAKALNLSMADFFKLLDETKSVSFLDIDTLRRKPGEIDSAKDSYELTLERDDPFSEIFLGQMRDIIAEAIDNLPEKEKLTVSLYYYDELTMKEIGEVLGYTESRISQMHSKAMLRLRSKLKKEMAL